MAETTGRMRRSYREGWRAWLSVAIATVIGFAIQIPLTLLGVIGTDRWSIVAASGLIWVYFCLVHAVWSYLTFRRLRGGDLARAVAVQRHRERRERSTWLLRLINSSNHAPSWAAQVSVVALVAVLLVVIVPGLRANQLILVVAMGLVVSSWLDTVIAYAVHYARLDLAGEPLIGFPGGGERTFIDYVYVSLAVQTTFGTTDAEILTSDMRRTTMVHGVLAFVFNSVIVAMIVSLLIG